MSMEKETVNDGLEQKTDDVTVETATEQKDAAAAASAEQGTVGTPAKKSKKKYIIAAVIAVLLVAVGAAAANYDTLSNFIRSKGSPESYYRYIAKKDRDKAVDKVVKSYNAMTKSIKLNDQQKKSTIKVEAGDALKPMLSSVGLESMEIETNAKVKDKVATSKSVLKVNGKDAMSYNLYADYKDGKVYMQIPELSDAYLDYSNLGDVDGQVNYVKAAGAVMDKVPDGDTLENVLTTYSDIVYDNLTGVTKKNQTVKVEGISKECTVLTAKADSKKVCDIAAKMAKQLKKDKDIKAIIEKADKSAKSYILASAAGALTFGSSPSSEAMFNVTIALLPLSTLISDLAFFVSPSNVQSKEYSANAGILFSSALMMISPLQLPFSNA